MAFERTFNLISEGKLGDLVLSDLGIIVVTVVVSLVVVGGIIMNIVIHLESED